MTNPRSKVPAQFWLALTCLVAAGGCQGSKKKDDVPLASEQRKALLGMAADCALANYKEFLTQAATLSTAVEALETAPGDSTREAARDAWRSAMATWQKVELFQFGPAARGDQPGAQQLRDQIYSWPLVSRCRIEEQLVSQAYATTPLNNLTINSRGLWALEYFLFYEGTDTACDSSSPVQGQWPPPDLDGRKRAYAAKAAQDVLAKAQALVNAWAPEGANFLQQMKTAGNAGSVYSSDQQALNAISDAMFYIEADSKDEKLARMIGAMDCADEGCPESKYAHASLHNVKQNIAAFDSLFLGCTPGATGFDDLLVAVNRAELAPTIQSKVTAAGNALKDIPEPELGVPVDQQLAAANVAYNALRELAVLLKTDFVGALDLELPASVETDND
jgi:predicted lipoprotein